MHDLQPDPDPGSRIPHNFKYMRQLHSAQLLFLFHEEEEEHSDAR